MDAARVRTPAGMLLLCGLLAACLARGAEPAPVAEKPSALELKPVSEDPNDAGRVARELVRTFMTDEAFEAKAGAMRKKYENWREENRGDMDRYLNDRIASVALAASGGKLEKLKEGAIFLAYYHEFKQPLPSMVADFVKDYRHSLNKLFAAFTWDAAVAYTKAKQWRRDLDEERKQPAEKSSAPRAEK